jgi:hypothetical protein
MARPVAERPSLDEIGGTAAQRLEWRESNEGEAAQKLGAMIERRRDWLT